MAEWSKAADCKSAGAAYEGSNPSPSTILTIYADLAQQVEHIHGKDGVSGSSPEVGSSFGNGPFSTVEDQRKGPAFFPSSFLRRDEGRPGLWDRPFCVFFCSPSRLTWGRSMLQYHGREWISEGVLLGGRCGKGALGALFGLGGAKSRHHIAAAGQNPSGGRNLKGGFADGKG